VVRLIRLAAAFALPISTTLAQASLTTIEPDDFANLQALNTAVPGVTLSVADGEGVPQEGDLVVAYEGDVASTGTLAFGRQIAGYWPPGDTWFLTTISVHSVFRADFDSPVAQVAIDVIRPDVPATANIGALLAYDASGTLLEVATARVDVTGEYATAALSRPNADIAYVLIGGYPSVSGPPFNNVGLDNFRFSHDVEVDTSVGSGEYFPLESGDQWTYQSSNSSFSWTDTTTVMPGTATVNGIATKMVQTQGSQGTETYYYTSDGNGIRLHRQVKAGQTVSFSPPIRLADVSAALGQSLSTSGTAALVIPQGTFNLSYTAVAVIPSFVTTAAPAGHFDTVKAETTVTLSGSVLGQPVDETEVNTYWFARHIGPVRRTVVASGLNVTSELTAAFIDHDGDGVSATSDNCPLLANPSQTDTDGDGRGDACDLDDDDDGVPDASDAFPLDATESLDTDLDGIGNNADPDDDNDGVPDTSDAFPLDATESVDTDLDGIGNNADPDDDNDGLSDNDEAILGTDSLKADTDGDGVSDGDEVAANTDPLVDEAARARNGAIAIINTILLGE